MYKSLRNDFCQEVFLYLLICRPPAPTLQEVGAVEANVRRKGLAPFYPTSFTTGINPVGSLPKSFSPVIGAQEGGEIGAAAFSKIVVFERLANGFRWGHVSCVEKGVQRAGDFYETDAISAVLLV